MKVTEVTVNLPHGEKTYPGRPGETLAETMERVTGDSPNWTSMVLVIVPRKEG
jgi:hypothetical protein